MEMMSFLGKVSTYCFPASLKKTKGKKVSVVALIYEYLYRGELLEEEECFSSSILKPFILKALFKGWKILGIFQSRKLSMGSKVNI